MLVSIFSNKTMEKFNLEKIFCNVIVRLEFFKSVWLHGDYLICEIKVRVYLFHFGNVSSMLVDPLCSTWLFIKSEVNKNYR